MHREMLGYLPHPQPTALYLGSQVLEALPPNTIARQAELAKLHSQAELGNEETA